MIRTSRALLAGLLLAAFGAAQAAEEGPAGTWKVSIFEQDQAKTFWIIKLEAKDGKWSGSVVATEEGVPKSTLENLTVTADKLRFSVKVGRQDLTFEGKVLKDPGQKILGSLAQGRQMIPAQLERTKLASLDAFEVGKETIANPKAGPEIFQAGLTLMAQAAEKKVKPEEVRGWAAKVFKAAEAYGPRWQREVAVRTAGVLLDQEGFTDVALQAARQAERLLEPADEAAVQMRVLEMLSKALKKAKKTDEAKEIDARVAKLEEKADQEYFKKMPPFKPEQYKGRKGKSERVSLVELFTGAQCPPCVAADLAFDALSKTYSPKDVVLLQYHLHIPGPDPMTNTDTEARAKYYGLRSTPNLFLNGELVKGMGGDASDSEERYKKLRPIIDELLEKETALKVKAAVTRKGNKIDINAEASGVAKPGENMRLRLALIEDTVRYTGGNQLRFHHHVVRDMPGGANGVALKEKTGKQTVSVDLDELRKKLSKYLDTAGEDPGTFPADRRPMDLKKLYVVAFVQDDDNKEVLQAVQVPVPVAEK